MEGGGRRGGRGEGGREAGGGGEVGGGGEGGGGGGGEAGCGEEGREEEGRGVRGIRMNHGSISMGRVSFCCRPDEFCGEKTRAACIEMVGLLDLVSTDALPGNAPVGAIASQCSIAGWTRMEALLVKESSVGAGLFGRRGLLGMSPKWCCDHGCGGPRYQVEIVPCRFLPYNQEKLHLHFLFSPLDENQNYPRPRH